MPVLAVSSADLLKTGNVHSDPGSCPAHTDGIVLFTDEMFWWPLHKYKEASSDEPPKLAEHIDVYRSALRGLLKLDEYTVMVALHINEEEKTLMLAQHVECQIFWRKGCVAQFFPDLHDTDRRSIESWVVGEKAETVRSWSYRQWHQFFLNRIAAVADEIEQRIDLFCGMQRARTLRASARP